MEQADAASVKRYLLGLQDGLCVAFERQDGRAVFEEDARLTGSDLARTRVLESGGVFEKATIGFTHARGDTLPAAATVARPELAGRGFEAVSLSLIIHPLNPYVPATHANLRLFSTVLAGSDPVWWFGGGFDLTPYYGFEEDAVHWHRTARAACAPFGAQVYPTFKQQCDRYFYLKHRDETRGVGGLFFDDLNAWGFERSFAFVRSLGDHFLRGYLPIVQRRHTHPYGDRERSFQLERRGRYVEFNLLYDRGTLYGLQSGRRVESVLASMPPLVGWRYGWRPEPGSAEARLAEEFLKPRDWLAGEGS